MQRVRSVLSVFEVIEQILNFDFKATDGVFDIEVLQHFWMQYSNASNNLSIEVYFCSSLGEVHLVFSLSDPIILLENSSNLGHQKI